MLDGHAIDSDSPQLSETAMGTALGAVWDEMAAERHGVQEALRQGSGHGLSRSGLGQPAVSGLGARPRGARPPREASV